MKTIALIDFSNVFFTLWHASAEQEMSAVVTKSVSTCENIAKNHDYCAICIDSPPYFRSKILPEYKAGREKPPLVYEQMRTAIKKLNEIGMVCYESKECEADDIIATLYILAADKKVKSFIYTTDKDMLQVDNIYNPFSGERITPQLKFGAEYHFQVPWILALTGDKADNITGINKVGPVNALKIIDAVGGHLGIWIKKPDYTKLNEKQSALLMENYDLIKRNLELVTVKNDVPIELILKKYQEVNLNETEAFEKIEEVFGEVEQIDKIPERPKTEERTIDIRQTPITNPVNFEQALEPTSMNEAILLADRLFKSRLFGDYTTPQSILAVILCGRSYGIDAVTSLMNFHIINGKPTSMPQLMQGMVLSKGACEYFDLIESTNEIATYETKRKGSKHAVKISFTIQDAENAGLTTGKNSHSWKKYPADMLCARCVSRICRRVYPDVIKGLYTKEELES